MGRLKQNRAWGIILLVLAAGMEAHAEPDCPLPAQHHGESVVVSHVHDGDTLLLKDGRKVRLLGVNTPELSSEPSYGAELALQAKHAVESFFRENRSAFFITDSQQRDKYGRWLGHLYNAEGENLEATLLRQGLGWHVVVPPNRHLADCLATAESWAVTSQLGVWKLPPVDAENVQYGGFQRVIGQVEKVTLAGAWWINLKGNISGVIYPENQGDFDPDEIRQLAGKRVEIQGWVYPSHSQKYQPWRIKIETGYALEVLP